MSSSSFWRSINILITKFNVINKRLWGCKILFRCVCKAKNVKYNKPHNCTKLNNEENITSFIQQICTEFDVVPNSELVIAGDDCMEIIIIELLPKSYTQTKAFQLILLEHFNTMASFYDITPKHYKQNICPDFTYSISLQNDTVLLDTGIG